MGRGQSLHTQYGMVGCIMGVKRCLLISCGAFSWLVEEERREERGERREEDEGGEDMRGKGEEESCVLRDPL